MFVYDSHYVKIDDSPAGSDEFEDKDEAIGYVLNQLPHEDFVYMVGTDDGIVAIVFQGVVYVPE